MHAPANELRGIIEPAWLRSEGGAVLDYALFICALIAIVGTAARMAIAPTTRTARPRRIEWDDPAEADG